MGEALGPCPLCGSEEIKVYVTGAQGAYRRGVVKCLGCGCRVEAESGGYHDYPHDDPRETYDMASSDARSGVIEKWNRRAERTCRYVYDEGLCGWVCSECGELEPVGDHVHYCPDCGARVVGL